MAAAARAAAEMAGDGGRSDGGGSNGIRDGGDGDGDNSVRQSASECVRVRQSASECVRVRQRCVSECAQRALQDTSGKRLIVCRSCNR